MITILSAALLAMLPWASDVGYEPLMSGEDGAAIARIEAAAPRDADLALLINLGIAYARSGESQRARTLFEQALNARDRIELETSTGAWVDSRVLARRALALLDSGQFARSNQLARN